MNPLAPTLYGFSNAKVAGLKSKFLSPQFYRTALPSKSVGAVLELLNSTPYAPFLKDASTIADVERGMTRRLAHLAKLLAKYVPQKDAELYGTFLRRYEFLNLKLVVGALAKGQEFEDVEPNIYPVSLPLSFWRSAFLDVRKLSSLFEIKEVPTLENLPEVMESIDAAYVSSQYSLRKTASYEFIVKDVDISNLLSLLAHKGRARFRLFGAIDEKRLERARKSEKERAALFTSFGLSGEENIPEAQMALEKRYALKKKARFYTTFFSLDKVLLFLLMLEEEGKNVRKILLSKQLNIPLERVEEVLII